jgi:hypothetical protein
MILNEAALTKLTRLVEIGDDTGDWEEWWPRTGLSLNHAVEVSAWCATANVGRHNPMLWFEAFQQCMTEAGYEYIAYRGQTLFAPKPPYPFDLGWVAVH